MSYELPPWHRSRLRWLNGIGFALTVFFGLWLIAFVLGLAQAGRVEGALPLPAAFVAVGALSLVASVAILCVLLFRYVFRGADLGEPMPRYLLFAWTCASGLFFLSQTLALAKIGVEPFGYVPNWLSTLFWYFVPVGALIFAVLLYVNADVRSEAAWAPDELDEFDEEAWEEGH